MPSRDTAREGIVVASFNLHAGVDGWGRRFDVIGACRLLDADVLVLQESFSEHGQVADSAKIADALGYSVIEVPLNHGSVLEPRRENAAATRWGPRPFSRSPRALRVAGPAIGRRRRARPGELSLASHRGSWNLAVLSRMPMRTEAVDELPALRGDPARRVAVVVELENGLRIAGTHLGHLTRGSLRQMRALSKRLAPVTLPTAVLGDMNCWGPLVSSAMPGFRRAVRGRTWPAWHPHSQIDHILVNGAVEVLGSDVLAALGSDHRAVRAKLALRS